MRRAAAGVQLTPDGRVDLDALRALMSRRTKVVAFAHVSNAMGTVNPYANRGDRAHGGRAHRV